MKWDMHIALAVAVVAALAAVILNAETANAHVEDSKPTLNPEPGILDGEFIAAGAEHKINPRLLKAIAIVESSLNPAAVNEADPSFGLMQILCKPGANGFCANRFNIRQWPATPDELLVPRRNLFYAGQILRWNLDQYGYPKAVAVYNSWKARHQFADTGFHNQAYVDKVDAHFQRLGGGNPNHGRASL